MKKMATIVLGLMLVLTLVGCGNNAQSSDAHNAEYEEGYAAGYEAGYNDGKQQIAESKKHFAQFSGSFMATVEQLLPDYYALPGKTIAVVHFFQDRPFLLHFQKDLQLSFRTARRHRAEFRFCREHRPGLGGVRTSWGGPADGPHRHGPL